MKLIFKYLVALLLLMSISTCKKKTTINVTVFNYAMNEPVANAKVVLVERKESGLFTSNTSCSEIANATTDANGNCSFDNEKLRSNSSYDYFLAVSNAYGVPQSYPCGGFSAGFLSKGKQQQKTLDASSFDAYLVVQTNNVLNPSQQGDSLIISIANPIYTVPGQPYPFGGGDIINAFYATTSPYFPFPSSMTSEVQGTNAGRNTVHIRKRKMGVTTTSVDTVKIYPNQTATVVINW
jgi:hypothetical protein